MVLQVRTGLTGENGSYRLEWDLQQGIGGTGEWDLKMKMGPTCENWSYICE